MCTKEEREKCIFMLVCYCMLLILTSVLHIVENIKENLSITALFSPLCGYHSNTTTNGQQGNFMAWIDRWSSYVTSWFSFPVPRTFKVFLSFHTQKYFRSVYMHVSLGFKENNSFSIFIYLFLVRKLQMLNKHYD